MKESHEPQYDQQSALLEWIVSCGELGCTRRNESLVGHAKQASRLASSRCRDVESRGTRRPKYTLNREFPLLRSHFSVRLYLEDTYWLGEPPSVFCFVPAKMAA